MTNNESIDLNKDNGKFIDPLDKPGVISLAKKHGSAQKIYKIPDNISLDSILLINIRN